MGKPQPISTAPNEVSLAISARDRLWCRAACEALDTFVIERLMRRFNELRAEPPLCEPGDNNEG